MRRRAVTFIEGMVVVAIIALLIAILFPALSAAKKNSLQRQADQLAKNPQQIVEVLGSWKLPTEHNRFLFIHEVELSEHIYFVVSKRYDGGVSLTHAKSCPCREE